MLSFSNATSHTLTVRNAALVAAFFVGQLAGAQGALGSSGTLGTPGTLGTLGTLGTQQADTDPEGAPPGSIDQPVQWYDTARAIERPDTASSLTASSTFASLNQAPEGDMPRNVAFTADGNQVLVVNRDTDNVSVFDFATRQLVATIDVGDYPVDIEVSPDGAVAAVPNLLSDTVSLIDLATLSVSATVPITQMSGSGQPFRAQFDTASSTLVVAVIDSTTPSRFSVIDVASAAETASIPVSPQGAIGFFGTPESGISGALFTDFALASDASFVLLPSGNTDTLNAYALPSGALLSSLPVGDRPVYVDLAATDDAAVVSLSGTTDAVVSLSITGGVPSVLSTTPTLNTAFDPKVRMTPDGAFAIVAVQNAVEFIDLSAGTSVETINTGTVGDIEITFDDQYAVVTNFNTRVIDLATRSVVRTLPVAPTYDAAVSPVSHRLVGINNRFAEDLHFYSTNGSGSQFFGRRLSGADPEVDAPRRVTITPDGRTALVAGLTSRTVASFDIESGVVTDVYQVGDRVWEIDTDAAGTVAVVTSTESDRVDVIDLVARQVVATLNVPTRPTRVDVSPDGTQAYVTTIAGTDRVHFLNLAGAASSVAGSVIAGQLGSLQFAYNQSSGTALSPDAATLAVCVSFDDELLLLDTATRAVLTRVPVGDFPIRAAWAPDGSAIYVTDTFGDTVTRVAFAGAASFATGTAASIAGPFSIDVDGDGDFLYVGERTSSANRLAVIDTATMSRVATVPLGGSVSFQERVGTTLFAAAGDGVRRVRLAGAASTVLDSVAISGLPSDLAFSPSQGLVVTTQPGVNDGIDLTRFGGVPVNGCGPAVPNSTGQSGTITANGTFLAGGFPLRLTATGLPNFSFGYFLNSRTTGFVMNPAGSQGNLCLGGTVGRFNSQTQNSGADGTITIDVDTTALPSVPMSVAIQPGDSWSFQLWHRDANPGVTSNFTDRVTVTFE